MQISTSQIKEMNTLTAKDLMSELGVSERTAYRIIKDVKDLYGIKAKKITRCNLNAYYGIPNSS